MTDRKPTLLLILDGWGCAAEGPGNAVCLAETPNLDRILAAYPSTRLACAGRAVGLPDGFMGNSEVGHMNIGAGRVVYQEMTRIDLAIEEGGFFENPAFTAACAAVKQTGGRLHLLGLVSDGGVHSHENHIYALLKLAREQGVGEVFVHAFMDGRDTPPASGIGYLERLQAKMRELGSGRIASVTGRFYAMDRDKRWERNELAWQALVRGQGQLVADPLAAVRDAYAAGETDEFIKPRVVTDTEGAPLARIGDGDAVIFFNFRADRARQLVRAFFDPEFAHFERGHRPELAAVASMTEYDATVPVSVAFPPQEITQTLGQVLSKSGRSQLRIAETEKYAHVTYFLNCGREEPWPGEERVLVPSPRDVATYDLKPEMSARKVTDILIERFQEFDLSVCNLANLDMVGHTGIIPAARQAVEVVDACVGRIVDAVLASGGRVLLTADHGNSEEMIDASGGVQTAHSLNPVPFVYIEAGREQARLRDGGKLGDIAPTILTLMGLPTPEQMTGTPLVLEFASPASQEA